MGFEKMVQRVRVKEEKPAERFARKTKKGELAFVKGGTRPEGSGRKKGQQNRHTTILKEVIFKGMEMVGSNNRGKDGAEGYMAHLAWKHPDIFGRLLEKVLPFSLAGAGGGPVQVEYTNKEEITLRIKERGLPLPIDLLAPPKRKPPAEVMDAEYVEVDESEEA